MTRHECDRCGAEVRSRTDLYRVVPVPVDADRLDRGAYGWDLKSKRDLCDKCVHDVLGVANEVPPRQARG